MFFRVFFSLLGLVLFCESANAQMVAFQLKEHIAVASLADAKPKLRKLVEGADPCISPDGTKVAYTQSDDEGNRRIAIYDLATGKSTLVKGIPGKNEFGAMWSSDGQKLVFNHFVESDWALASVNAAGEGFQIIVDKGVKQVAGFASTPGSPGWLCHDMEGFFTVSPGEKSSWNIFHLRQSTTLDGLTMPSRIAVSPDGKTALFDQSVDEDVKPTDDGPPSAIFQIELNEAAKITRITPKGLYADGPAWLPDGKSFLFGSFDSKTQQETIHRLSIEPGAKPVLWLKNGRNPTVSAK